MSSSNVRPRATIYYEKEEAIGKWLDAQDNKTASIRVLIKHAINQFGEDVDILQALFNLSPMYLGERQSTQQPAPPQVAQNQQTQQPVQYQQAPVQPVAQQPIMQPQQVTQNQQTQQPVQYQQVPTQQAVAPQKEEAPFPTEANDPDTQPFTSNRISYRTGL